METDWHKKVYKQVEPEKTPVEWKTLREYIIGRDRGMCLRCDKHFPKNKLSVHHMIPRAEGGGDNQENLVTLCNECHDYVEVYGLKTRADIMGSLDTGTNASDSTETLTEKDPYDRPEWHKWVYGGIRNPKA